jgi:hypothetical protein
MQTVRPTAGGVDILSGFTSGKPNGGRITHPVAVRNIGRRINTERAQENLSPVFNEAGEVYAYERTADVAELSRLDRSTHFGKMLGAWKGRQIEEPLGLQMNQTLVDKLYEMHKNDMLDQGKASEYVDLFNDRNLDPVVKDALRLLNQPTREYIESVFGDTFPVRKDMLEQVIGIRTRAIPVGLRPLRRQSERLLSASSGTRLIVSWSPVRRPSKTL